MADEKKKAGLTEKIGLFIDKALTFGGGLDYSNTQLKNAINALDAKTDYPINSWRDIKFQDDFNDLKSILRSMKKDSDS